MLVIYLVHIFLCTYYTYSTTITKCPNIETKYCFLSTLYTALSISVLSWAESHLAALIGIIILTLHHHHSPAPCLAHSVPPALVHLQCHPAHLLRDCDHVTVCGQSHQLYTYTGINNSDRTAFHRLAFFIDSFITQVNGVFPPPWLN